jgi:RNA-directed DNA polymerase
MDIAKVQKSLATKASYQPQHRFNDLYRYVRHRKWLEAARQSVLRNKGARTPGIDGVVPKDLTEAEWREMLDQLVVELKEGTYRPQPARRKYVPKANGKVRPLGIAIPRSHCTSIQWALGFGHDWTARAAQSVYHRLITLSNGVTSACAPVCAVR